jgi:hypothetical protein
LCANLREKGGRVAASRFDWILSAYLEGTPQTTEKLSTREVSFSDARLESLPPRSVERAKVVASAFWKRGLLPFLVKPRIQSRGSFCLLEYFNTILILSIDFK